MGASFMRKRLCRHAGGGSDCLARTSVCAWKTPCGGQASGEDTVSVSESALEHMYYSSTDHHPQILETMNGIGMEDYHVKRALDRAEDRGISFVLPKVFPV
jgi:hypothetical protein